MGEHAGAGGGRSAAGRAFWPLLVATLAIIAAFRLWSTPAFEAYGVEGPLDSLFGYDLAKVEAYLAELGSEGRSFYLNGFHRLDTAFPLAYGATLICGFAMLLARPNGAVRWLVAAALVLPGVLLDYSENALVAELLRTQVLDPAAVERASLITQAKWVFVSAPTVGVLGLAIAAAVRRVAAGAAR